MGHNVDFQERWEFRRKEINEDSSSDDNSKSSSEQFLKNQRLIVEDDYHSDIPAQKEPKVRKLSAKGKSKCKKPRKKQARAIKKKKSVNEKMDGALVKKDKIIKRKGFRYDPRLMDDVKSFSESLLEDMKVTGEKLFFRMKEQMYELISRGPRYPKLNKGGNQMVFPQVQNQMNFRFYANLNGYDQMTIGPDNLLIQEQQNLNGNCFIMDDMMRQPTREGINYVYDFPRVQHQRGMVFGRELPNTFLNRPFVMSGRSEGTKAMNVQHESNLKANVTLVTDATRQLQTMANGRVPPNGNFSGPIILREREREEKV
uniref:Uncharacterized protein n=1 Tax=Kalanchoe fedtschenkoi TaxID=63787 RepID=A0A7N0UWX2_KALFE